MCTIVMPDILQWLLLLYFQLPPITVTVMTRWYPLHVIPISNKFFHTCDIHSSDIHFKWYPFQVISISSDINFKWYPFQVISSSGDTYLIWYPSVVISSVIASRKCWWGPYSTAVDLVRTLRPPTPPPRPILMKLHPLILLLPLLLLPGGHANDLPSFTLASLRPTSSPEPRPPDLDPRGHQAGGHEPARPDSHREDKSLLPEVAVKKVKIQS